MAFRVIAGGEHPHFTTVNQFRLTHREALAKLFVQVLRLCKRAGSFVCATHNLLKIFRHGGIAFIAASAPA